MGETLVIQCSGRRRHVKKRLSVCLFQNQQMVCSLLHVRRTFSAIVPRSIRMLQPSRRCHSHTSAAILNTHIPHWIGVLACLWMANGRTPLSPPQKSVECMLSVSVYNLGVIVWYDWCSRSATWKTEDAIDAVWCMCVANVAVPSEHNGYSLLSYRERPGTRLSNRTRGVVMFQWNTKCGRTDGRVKARMTWTTHRLLSREVRRADEAYWRRNKDAMLNLYLLNALAKRLDNIQNRQWITV